jgi:hypothetical protein
LAGKVGGYLLAEFGDSSSDLLATQEYFEHGRNSSIGSTQQLALSPLTFLAKGLQHRGHGYCQKNLLAANSHE